MKTSSRNGADFIVTDVRDDFILLKDLDIGNKSVTNDAEAVVDMVLSEHGNEKRIFYVDSCGSIDELCHNGERFTHFHFGIPSEFLEELEN